MRVKCKDRKDESAGSNLPPIGLRYRPIDRIESGGYGYYLKAGDVFDPRDLGEAWGEEEGGFEVSAILRADIVAIQSLCDMLAPGSFVLIWAWEEL